MGLELEVSARPVEGLSVDGALSYLDFEYGTTGTSGVPVNGITPYTPNWTYSFGLQYDHELSSGDTISGRFDGSYKGDFFSDAFNTPASQVDGYFIGGARIWFRNSENQWQVSLEVQNLFDKFYYYTKSDLTTIYNAVAATPGMPRTWSVTVRKDF